MEKEIKNLSLTVENDADILTSYSAVKQINTANLMAVVDYIFGYIPKKWKDCQKQIGKYTVTFAKAKTDEETRYHNLRISQVNKGHRFDAWLTDLIY